MTFTVAQVTATSTATSTLAVNTLSVGRTLKNKSTTVTVYWGNASVTSGTGFPIYPGEELNVNDYLGVIYTITASGTAVIEVQEQM